MPQSTTISAPAGLTGLTLDPGAVSHSHNGNGLRSRRPQAVPSSQEFHAILEEIFTGLDTHLKELGYSRGPTFKELRATLRAHGYRVAPAFLSKQLYRLNLAREAAGCSPLKTATCDRGAIEAACAAAEARVRETASIVRPVRVDEALTELARQGWEVERSAFLRRVATINLERKKEHLPPLCFARLTPALVGAAYEGAQRRLIAGGFTRRPLPPEIAHELKLNGISVTMPALLRKLHSCNRQRARQGLPPYLTARLQRSDIEEMHRLASSAGPQTHYQVWQKLTAAGWRLTYRSFLRQVDSINQERRGEKKKQLAFTLLGESDLVEHYQRKFHGRQYRKRPPTIDQFSRSLRSEGWRVTRQELRTLLGRINVRRISAGLAPFAVRELTLDRVVDAHGKAAKLVAQQGLKRDPSAEEIGAVLRRQGFRVWAARVITLLSDANGVRRRQNIAPLGLATLTERVIIQAYENARARLVEKGFTRNPVFKELKRSLEILGWRLADVSLYERLRAINRHRKNKLDVSPFNDEKLLKICRGLKAEVRRTDAKRLPTLNELHARVKAAGWSVSREALRRGLNRVERGRSWKQEELVLPDCLAGRLLRRLHHEVKAGLKKRGLTRDPFADEMLAAIRSVGVRCHRRQLLARLRDVNRRIRRAGCSTLKLGELDDHNLARFIRGCRRKGSAGISYDQLLWRLRKEGYHVSRSQVIKRVANMNGRRLAAGRARLVVRNARGRGKIPADAIEHACRSSQSVLRQKGVKRAPLEEEVCSRLRREGYKMQPKALRRRVEVLNVERAQHGQRRLVVLRWRDVLGPETARDAFMSLLRRLGRSPLLPEYRKELSKVTEFKPGPWQAHAALRAYNEARKDGERLILNSCSHGFYDEDIIAAHADIMTTEGLPPTLDRLAEALSKRKKGSTIPTSALGVRVARLRKHGLELELVGMRKVTPELLKREVPALAEELGRRPYLQQVKSHLQKKYKISFNGHAPIAHALRRLRASLPEDQREMFDLQPEPLRQFKAADFERAFFVEQQKRPVQGLPGRAGVARRLKCSLQLMQQLHREANEERALRQEMPLLFSGHPVAKQLRILDAFEAVLRKGDKGENYLWSLAGELGWSDRYLRDRMRKFNRILRRDGLSGLPLPSTRIAVGALSRPHWERQIKIYRTWAVAGLGLSREAKAEALRQANVQAETLYDEVSARWNRDTPDLLEDLRAACIGLHMLQPAGRLSERGVEVFVGQIAACSRTPAAFNHQIEVLLSYTLEMSGFKQGKGKAAAAARNGSPDL